MVFYFELSVTEIIPYRQYTAEFFSKMKNKTCRWPEGLPVAVKSLFRFLILDLNQPAVSGDKKVAKLKTPFRRLRTARKPLVLRHSAKCSCNKQTKMQACNARRLCGKKRWRDTPPKSRRIVSVLAPAIPQALHLLKFAKKHSAGTFG